MPPVDSIKKIWKYATVMCTSTGNNTNHMLSWL